MPPRKSGRSVDSALDRVASRWKLFSGETDLHQNVQPQIRESFLDRVVKPLPTSNLDRQLRGMGPGLFGSAPSTFTSPLFGRGAGFGAPGVFGNLKPFRDPFEGRLRDETQAPAQPGARLPGSGGAMSGFSGDPSKAVRVAGVEQWMPVIKQVASETGVPWEILAASMAIESGGEQYANNSDTAFGLMQVQRKWWEPRIAQLGGDVYDPYTNITIFAEYIKSQYDRLGSWEGAVMHNFGGAWDPTTNRPKDVVDHSNGTTSNQYWDILRNNLAYFGWGQSSNPSGSSVIEAAQTAIGTPYVWGGKRPGGFDCSGLTQWAYAQSGKQIPPSSQTQYEAAYKVAPEQAQPGDLVFFTFPESVVQNGQGGTVNHVGIYLGNGQMLHASTNGGDVHVRQIDPWYQQYLTGYGRF